MRANASRRTSARLRWELEQVRAEPIITDEFLILALNSGARCDRIEILKTDCISRVFCRVQRSVSEQIRRFP